MAPDVVVIGAGVAGLVAALAALRRGARTLVLARGFGSIHLGTGCIDLLGRDPSQGLAPVDRPLPAVESLAGSAPEHPYGLAGPDALLAGLTVLREACEAEGHPLIGSPDGSNLRLPTAIGALRRTFLAPPSMIAGDLRGARMRGEVTLIAGIEGFRDFYPGLAAANLARKGFAAAAVELSAAEIGARRGAMPADLARQFDDAAARERLARALRPHVDVRRPARVALPAVLGLRDGLAAHADLERRLGVPVCEIPTLPPSVPGMRLQQALVRAIRRRGGRVQVGCPVVGAVRENFRCEAVIVASAARETRIRARAVVLATGGLGGAGIDAGPDGNLRETVLGLPVTGPPSRDAWFETDFLPRGGHPIEFTGVRVDPGMRPLDGAGRPALANVTAAGGLLAGSDRVGEGCHEGVAIATGYRAVQTLAAEESREEGREWTRRSS